VSREAADAVIDEREAERERQIQQQGLAIVPRDQAKASWHVAEVCGE
jgi:hypothetical protein